MRERGLQIREWGLVPMMPLDMAMGFLWRHGTMWIVCALAAALLGHVGAFRTAETAAAIRYPYFLTLTFSGGVFGSLLLDRFDTAKLFQDRVIARAAALVLAISFLLTPVVWIMAGSVLNGSWQLGRMTALFPQVVPVAAVFVLLQSVFVRHGTATEQTIGVQPTEIQSACDGALATKWRAAGLQAVEAEDHYLRLHTAEGSTLVMMRLADAIAELRDVDGGQTHRSWWVARDAVVSAARGRGRAALQLRNGLKAPVSRTYAPILREAGWY